MYLYHALVANLTENIKKRSVYRPMLNGPWIKIVIVRCYFFSLLSTSLYREEIAPADPEAMPAKRFVKGMAQS